MTLDELFASLSRVNQREVRIVGRYGSITAHPDGGQFSDTLEPTYRVDAEYQRAREISTIRVSQSGFRFSTVCCLCAAVCLGEDRVSPGVIADINRLFA